MNKSKRKSVAPSEPPRQEPQPMDVDGDNLQMSDDEEGGTRIGDIYIPPPIPPHCSTESKGPRLIITQIVNENFKSYAGKVTLGPFHHCFSSIIGPNGSGKSNVIDSMLFVFGYRAQKIRSKKLSVLLHNSAKFPDINRCSVAVHFVQILDKEHGECEVIPNSEIVVTRTAFKDNSSYYAINDRRVQFKEVSKLLRQHGIDLDHNRFLILQGEVESIAMMKPKGATENECGLLEYLEDIIGTSRYKQPLIKINEKVEFLNEERTEKHNRCKLAEREMKDLEKPMNEAVEYLKLENSLTRSKNLQIQKYLSEQAKKLIKFEEEKQEVTSVLQGHDKKYEELKKEREEKENLIREEIANHEALLKKKDNFEQMLKNALNKYTEVQASMAATNKRRKQTMAQLAKEKENLDDLQKMPHKNKGEIEECSSKIEKLTKQKTELEEKLALNLSTLKDETKGLIEEKEQHQTKLIDLKKGVDESKSELAIVESELKICQHSETLEKRKYETLRISYEESCDSLKEKRNNLAEIKTNIPETQQNLQEAQHNLEMNKKEEVDMRKKLQQCRSTLEEITNNMQASKSRDKVLNSLMKQKQSGHIPGILGRLGDLGGIDAKYDVAISTCCGRLDNIVVDTVNTAQACIEYLKKYDVGRASFIALEKIQHLLQYCNNQIRTPENVPRVFDLIRMEDERVLPAFYFALRDTLVANDLDQGTRIAYGATRYRVVTLRGDVIETSGTMSGGGKTVMRGRMGQQVATKTSGSTPKSQKEIEGLQVRAEKMQSEINYLQEQQGAFIKEISNLTTLLKTKENEMKKLEFDIKSLAEQLPRLADQLKKQKEKMENTTSDPEKVKQLKCQIEEKKSIFEKSQTAAKKISDKVDVITSKINEITDAKVKDVKAKISELSKQIDKLTTNISKLTVSITTAERNYKKTLEKIENMEAEIEAAVESIKKGSEEREQCDQDATDLKAKIEEMKEELSKTQEGSSEIKKRIVGIQKEESAGKMKRLEIEEKLKAVEKKITDVNDQLPHWGNKLKPLKLQEIPNEPPPDPLKTYTEEELDTYKLQDVQYQISVQEEKLNENKPNLSVIPEYLKKRETYLQRVQVLEDITNKRNEMRNLYDDVRKKRFTEFTQGFHIITRKLKEMYQMITLGGDAELELVDSMDPFNEGVVFSVRPPKKSWKMISNLSGGEKTLSSLALVFALHYYKPSPLYVMDEIDAALDFKNVSIVAHYIKERTKNAQFVIISLRSNMFELSDYLVGIFKVEDCTGSLTIKNINPHNNNNNGSVENSDEPLIGSNQSGINLNYENPEMNMENSQQNSQQRVMIEAD